MTKTSSPTSPDSVRRLVVDLPCGKKSLVRARQKVIRFASDHGFSAEAEDVALATQEALKNIIQHACPADDNMHFECVVTDDSLIIDVTDEGQGFDTAVLSNDGHGAQADALDPDELLSLHGRGIRLIHGLMDDVWITSDQEGTVVHMEKKHPSAAK